jgi:hypothetical protein
MFKCFRCYQIHVVSIYMDVAKVDRDVVYVASVSEAFCKRLFKMFHQFQTYVANVFIWMLHTFHTYVVIVYSKCFSYFSLMLQ